MNIEDVKEFIRLVSQSEVNELHIETPGMKVKIRKGTAGEDSPIKGANGSNPGLDAGGRIRPASLPESRGLQWARAGPT